MLSTQRLPILDSTVYPHLLDLIVEHSGAASTLVAFRRASRRCKELADTKLIHHATLRREWYQPCRTLLDALLWRPEPPRRRRCMLVAGLDSGIDDDHSLPLVLLDKVCILDLVGADMAEHKSYEFYARKRELRPKQRARRTELDGSYAFPKAPRVLRRFGRSAQEDWGSVLDTTVDFVDPPGGKDYRSFRSIKVPLSSPRYVLHLDLPAEGELDDFFGFHYAWERTKDKRDLPDVTLVLSPHSAPGRKVVEKAVIRVATQFMGPLMLGTTALTVVGLEGWLPGVSPGEFTYDVFDAAVAACIADWRRPREYEPDAELVERAYQSIRYMSLQEWWDELGDRKGLVGVWPGR